MSGLYTIEDTYSGLYYGYSGDTDAFGAYSRYAVSMRYHSAVPAPVVADLYDQREMRLKACFKARLTEMLYGKVPMESKNVARHASNGENRGLTEESSKDDELDASSEREDDGDFQDEESEDEEPIKLGKRDCISPPETPRKRSRVSDADNSMDTRYSSTPIEVQAPQTPPSGLTLKQTPKSSPKRRTKIVTPSAPIQCKDSRLAIILSSVGEMQQKRAHLQQFYSSLQPGPQQLQMLGELDHHLNREERITYMNADEWIVKGSLQRWEVQCRGCLKLIKLEGPRKDREAKVRNPRALKKDAVEFYPGNWNKHRNQCRGVYTTWCEENGLVPDEGRPTKTRKMAGRANITVKKPEDMEDVEEVRPMKALPTRTTRSGGRRASLVTLN